MSKVTTPGEVVRPTWAAPDNVVAFTTTRIGGVSHRPFDGFNLAQHVDDNVQDVGNNRRILKSHFSLPSEPAWLEQIHGTTIIRLEDGAAGGGSADGSITCAPGRVCAIMTADCMPLFMCNEQGNQVALVHAGWRGMADGIIEKLVELFDQPPDQLVAWAGPTIGPDRFEIGVEVKDQLKGPSQAYLKTATKDKYLADLYQIAGAKLSAVGVHEYSHSNHCSYQDQSLFYSYRRSNITGRMASIIYFE